MSSAWQLYYDGGCNLCHASKLRAEKWAARAGRPLEVDVLQSKEARDKGYLAEMVVEADGKVYKGSKAWMKLMELAPPYLRWVSNLGKIPPFGWLLEAGYKLIARFRFRLFGRRACPLPSKSVAGESPK